MPCPDGTIVCGTPCPPETHTGTSVSVSPPPTPDVYIVDNGTGSVEKVPPMSPQTTPITGLNSPQGIAVDSAGNVYITNTAVNEVLKYPAGGGSPVSIATGLNKPQGVAVDDVGNVYIADTGNNRIVEVPHSGSQFTVPLGTEGTTPVTLNSPYDVAVDSEGDVFVLDTGNDRVLWLAAGPTVGGGNAVQTETVASGLDAPQSLAVDANGDVYIADTYHDQIVELATTGAGILAPETFATGLDLPTGVTTDAAGNVYVANYLGHDVLQYPPGGGTSTVVGSGLDYPTDMAVNSPSVDSGTGATVTLSATIMALSTWGDRGNSGQLLQGGSVTFYSGATALGTVAAPNEDTPATVTLAVNNLSVGPNSITASYSGYTIPQGGDVFGSTSAPINVDVFQPTVTRVRIFGGYAQPAIVVSGSGFGASPPSPAYPPPACPGATTGLLYGNSFYFQDLTNSWTAGQGGPGGSGACLGLVVTSWSDSQIIFSFGTDYRAVNQLILRESDSYSLSLYGTTSTGKVSFIARVKFYPKSGPPGLAVTASGGGFFPGETVSVVFDTGSVRVGICTATAAADGTYHCSGQIPPATDFPALPLNCYVKVSGATSKLVSHTFFFVT
jgi:sugar lactone lactonase YvrE